MSADISVLEEHGTAKGYRRHHRKGEKPCASCVVGMSAHRLDYRARNREHIQARDRAYRRRISRNRRLSKSMNRAIANYVATETVDTRDTLFTFWELAAGLREQNLR